MRPGVSKQIEFALLPIELPESTVRPSMRAGAGLETRDRESGVLQLFGQMCRGSLAGAAAGNTRSGTNMNTAAHERAGSDHDRASRKATPLQSLDAVHL